MRYIRRCYRQHTNPAMHLKIHITNIWIWHGRLIRQPHEPQLLLNIIKIIKVTKITNGIITEIKIDYIKINFEIFLSGVKWHFQVYSQRKYLRKKQSVKERLKTYLNSKKCSGRDIVESSHDCKKNTISINEWQQL